MQEQSFCIGGGIPRWSQISVGGEIKKVRSRGGLFGGDIRVVTDGPHRGKILIPFWESMLAHIARQSGEYSDDYWDQKWLIYQMFESVYEAVRYTYHILDENYGITFQQGEKGRLAAARQALMDLNMVAIGLRKGNVKELMLTLQERSGFIIRQVGEQPHDKLKCQALKHSIRLGTAFDSLKRVNLGAYRAVTVTADDELAHRIVDIRCIEPKILARRQTLKAVIEEMELYLNGIYEFLTLLLREDELQKDQRSDRKKCEELYSHLTLYLRRIALYDILPFSWTAYYIGREFANARILLERGEWHPALVLLRSSWSSLALRQLRTDIEEVILKITFMLFGKPKEINVKQASDLADELVGFTGRLSQIDDLSFRQPVVKKVWPLINSAEHQLCDHTVASVRAAKDWLKQAASLL